MIEEKRTAVDDNLEYSRTNVWEVKLYLNNEKMEIVHNSFHIAIVKVKKILMNYYKVIKEALEVYAYYYIEDEFNLYYCSYNSIRKACEMFYEYNLIRNCNCNTIDTYVDIDAKAVNLYSVNKSIGGKFIGCYYDGEHTKRPLTSKKEYVQIFPIYNRFLFRLYTTFPSALILEKFSTEQKINSFGGIEEGVNYIRRFIQDYEYNGNEEKLGEDLISIFFDSGCNYSLIPLLFKSQIEIIGNQFEKKLNIKFDCNLIEACLDFRELYNMLKEFAYVNRKEYLPRLF